MILRDRDVTVDPCCDNVISTIMAEAHQVHQRDVRDHQTVTVLISSFFLPKVPKILIHKEKSRLPFLATAHRDSEIFQKAVLFFFVASWKRRRAIIEGPRRRSALRIR